MIIIVDGSVLWELLASIVSIFKQGFEACSSCFLRLPQAHRWWVRTDWTPSVYAIQNPVSRRGVKAAGILLPAVVPWSMARKAMGFVRTRSTKCFCGSNLLLPLSVLRQVLAVVFGLAKVFITGVFAEFEGTSQKMNYRISANSFRTCM